MPCPPFALAHDSSFASTHFLCSIISTDSRDGEDTLGQWARRRMEGIRRQQLTLTNGDPFTEEGKPLEQQLDAFDGGQSAGDIQSTGTVAAESGADVSSVGETSRDR